MVSRGSQIAGNAAILGDGAWRAAAKFLQHAHRGADLSRRAVAALEAIVFDEGLLHRVQYSRLRESLDRGDLPSLI